MSRRRSRRVLLARPTRTEGRLVPRPVSERFGVRTGTWLARLQRHARCRQGDAVNDTLGSPRVRRRCSTGPASVGLRIGSGLGWTRIGMGRALEPGNRSQRAGGHGTSLARDALHTALASVRAGQLDLVRASVQTRCAGEQMPVGPRTRVRNAASSASCSCARTTETWAAADQFGGRHRHPRVAGRAVTTRRDRRHGGRDLG